MKSTISIRRVLLGLCGLLVFTYASGFIWVWGRTAILPAVPETLANYDSTRVPVVYHPLYNISLLGIEQLHPFDTFKYQKVFDGLVAAGRFTADDIYHPPYATIAMLERVHDPDYLDRIKQAAAIAEMTEVTPLSLLPAGVLQKAVLDAQRLATGGTVLAAELALAHGWAINLGGGYHHAAPHRGWGFSAYNDVAIAWQHLKSERNLQRVMIIDLDAHQGDGTGYALGDDPDAYL